MSIEKITLPGTGSDVAVDTTPEGNVQVIKLAQSTDSSSSLIPADASGMYVQLGTGLPAGTAAIGKLAANSGVDIGDVDIKSIAAGTSIIGKVYLTDGTNDVALLNLTNSKPIPFAQVDSEGNQLPLDPPIYPAITPTLTAVTYAAGYNLGGAALAVTDAASSSGGSGHLLSLTFIDKDDLVHDGTNGQYLAHIYSGTVTPGANNAAFGLASDTEAAKYIATIDSSDGDWYSQGSTIAKACTVFPPKGPIPYRCIGSTSLYICIVQKTVASGAASAGTPLVIVPHCVRD